MLVEMEELADAIEAFALHDFGASAGQESFVLVGVMVVEICRHHEVEHSVAEVFQSLIVHPVAVGVFHGHGAVHECQSVEFNVFRVESCKVMYKDIKPLILRGKELYE